MLEDTGAFLIPWMGDSSLMVDRYDVRNKLEDKTQFGLKSNLPHRMTDEEVELEEELDRERYRCLGNDILEEELEEDTKRQGEGPYQAVGYSYDTNDEDTPLPNMFPQPLEHPPTTSVDIIETAADVYNFPSQLYIPGYINTPKTQKQHSIIERTAKFINQQGQQMEIIIKTKQKFNAHFSFLHHEDRLFPYYKFILNAINKGAYTPQEEEGEVSEEEVNVQKEEKDTKLSPENGDKKADPADIKKDWNKSLIESDDDSDNEGAELHPLLMGTSSKPKAPPISNKFKSGSFKNIALTINAAPAIVDTASATKETSSTSSNNADSASTYYYHPGSEYDMMAAYYHASRMFQSGPHPPPAELQPIVDKTAEYVAKNGDHFERTLILKHLLDSRFEFLHPWNEYNGYYKAKISETRDNIQKEMEASLPSGTQRLGSQGSVSFKVTAIPKKQLNPQYCIENMEDEEEENIAQCNGKKKGELIETGLDTKKPKLSDKETTFKEFLSTVRGLLKKS